MWGKVDEERVGKGKVEVWGGNVVKKGNVAIFSVK